MAQSTFAKVSAAIILFFILAMMGSCLIPLAHGATTQPRSNSLGVSQTYENPFEYTFGTVDHIDALSNATVITLKPFGSSLLNNEALLLCGDLTKEFENDTTGSMYIITFRRVTTRTYHGIGCHDVYKIILLHFKDGGVN